MTAADILAEVHEYAQLAAEQTFRSTGTVIALLRDARFTPADVARAETMVAETRTRIENLRSIITARRRDLGTHYDVLLALVNKVMSDFSALAVLLRPRQNKDYAVFTVAFQQQAQHAQRHIREFINITAGMLQEEFRARRAA